MNLILGTCRLQAFASTKQSLTVSDHLSRPTNSREHLQLIQYLKHHNIHDNDLYFTFEYCIHGKRPFAHSKYLELKTQFDNADYYVL
jgi:hypothetical protein